MRVFRAYGSALLFWIAPFVLLLLKAPELSFYLESADHGYQLSLGRQVVLGKFPYVDQFFHYGPLTAFTSAIGIWLWDSLISETLICAFGYACSIFLIHYLTKRNISNIFGYAAPALSFLLLARFYKWYYWLFPMLALYIVDKFVRVREKDGFWLLGAGFLSGISGLYRLDLGLLNFVFFLCVIPFLGVPFKPRKIFKDIGIFVLIFLISFFIWFVPLYLHGGTVQDYFLSTLVGGHGIQTEWSLSLPKFNWQQLLSEESSLYVALLVLFLSALFCIFSALSIYVRHLRKGQINDRSYLFPFAVGLMAIGISPQALVRADIHHFLQVLPPVILAVGCSLMHIQSRSWHYRNHRYRIHKLISQLIRVSLVIILSLIVWRIQDFGQLELTSWHTSPISRYKQLNQGVNADIEHPIVDLIHSIQSNVEQDEPILVIPIACQIYYFADRPMSGFINAFAAGNIDTPEWRARNLAIIKSTPPKVVVSQALLSDLSTDDSFRVRQPELYSYLVERYTKVVYQSEGWLLLASDTKPI
ncbi:MAG: hypothetical protein F6K31_28505 [Symploca sp. SIO2G7]|nr:hypothetical protein [Symploca sp. SIO2G7]